MSGHDPITGAQASYLTTLCEEAGVEMHDGDLTKAEASLYIVELKARPRARLIALERISIMLDHIRTS